MLEFLTPPTDNLYKFQALAGLFLVVFCFTYPPWLLHRAIVGKQVADAKVAELGVELFITQNRRDDVIKIRFEANEKRKSHLEQKIQFLEYQLARKEDGRLEAEKEALQKRFDDAILESEKLVDTFYDLDLAYSVKKAQLDHALIMSKSELSDSRWILGVATIFGLIGIVLSGLGFFRWQRRVQNLLDEHLVKQLAKADEP